jgi:hypothetical protein
MTIGAKSKRWKEIQDLVGRIEAALGPDAAVTSPDHLIDKTTGLSREADVSIRQIIGSQPVLIIEECRDRSKKVGVGYVEEVATKRGNVGADRAVIVSTVGFTRGAIKKATFYSIGLMTLTEALEADWTDWLLPTTMTILYNRSNALNIEFILARDSDRESLSHEFNISNPERVALLRANGNVWGNVGTAFVGAANNIDAFGSIAPGDPRVRSKFGTRFSDGPVFIQIEERLIEIRQLNFDVELWVEAKEMPFERYSYADPSGGADIRYADVCFDVTTGDRQLRSRVYLVKGPQGTGVFAEITPDKTSDELTST